MIFAGDISDVMSDGEEQRRFEACERSELGDASRETSPTDTQGLSVELCLKKKTDTHITVLQ